MAVKTITIDMAAYEILDAEKQDGESFSKVIKRKIGSVSTAADLLRGLDRILLEADTLNRLDEIVCARKNSLVEPIRMSED